MGVLYAFLLLGRPLKKIEINPAILHLYYIFEQHHLVQALGLNVVSLFS